MATMVPVESGPDQGAPWHYGDPYRETRALESGAAFVDLGHRGLITISGLDRLVWLNNLTSQELLDWPTNTWRTALILSPQGHIERELLLVDDGERTWIDTEPSEVAPLMAYLEKMKFMLAVEVKDVHEEFQLIRDFGAPDEIGGPYKIIKRGALPVGDRAGIWALEALRVAQGRARLGFESDYKSIPNELGYLNRAVHMRKGCYRGQETVAKVFNLGHPPRRLVRLHLDGSEIDLPPMGEKIFLGENEVGFIATVVRHFEQGPIALAVIRRTVPVSAQLTVGGLPALQEVIVAAE